MDRNENNGFKSFFNWLSVIFDWTGYVQRVISINGFRIWFVSEWVLVCVGDDDADGPILFTDLARENMVIFVFSVVVVVSLVSVLLVNFYIVFPPSLSESPLSLLFILNDISISSCWFLVFFLFGVCVVAGAAAIVVVIVVVGLVGDDFFLFLFTRVHPSSFSGWTPVSGFEFFVAVAVVVVIVVVVVAFTVSDVVLVILGPVMIVFWGHDLEKYPSFLQFQKVVSCPQRPPSSLCPCM